jgi:hypothetical protein
MGTTSIVVATITAFGLIAAAVVTGLRSRHRGDGDRPQPQEPAGRVVAPLTGDRLERAFTAEGTLAAIPPDRHVWLAVQVDNLLFPKEPEIPRADRRWSAQVVQGGDPSEDFALALLMVDADGQRVIERWLSRGQRSGDYPGLERITGSAKLDVVRNLTIR